MRRAHPRNRPTHAHVSPARRWLVYGAALGLWITGAAWLYFHYFRQAHGAFGPAPDPSEPWWLKLHGAFAFAALWAFGLMWGVHVVKGWETTRRRWSGALFVGVLILLIVTAYLLYYLGDDSLRPLVSILHWAVGLGCPGLFLVHRYGLAEKKARDANGAVE